MNPFFYMALEASTALAEIHFCRQRAWGPTAQWR